MIDEQQLIDELLNNYLVKNNGTWNDAMDRALELIKSSPKVGKWIPVSEDMPRFGEKVLCSLNLDNPTIIHPVIISTRNTDKYWYDGTIVAWMPLPEPYREKVEE